MEKRNVIIIQSYEEVRFLLELIFNKKFPKINFIYVYGNNDLFNHISKLIKKRKDIKISLISPLPLYQQAISNISPYLGSLIFYKKFFFKVENLYFLTRICAIHFISILKIAKIKKINSNYVNVPFKKTYYEKKNSVIYGLDKFLPRNFNDFIYSLFYSIFFAREIELLRISFSRVTVMRKEFLKNNAITNYEFLQSNKDFLYFRNYEKMNYFNPTFNKSKYVIFYDQNYHQRPIVDIAKYESLMKTIFEKINKLNLKIYFKAHPNTNFVKPEFIPNYVKFIDSYIPSEFTSRTNSIPISITSGAITNSINPNLVISIVNLIPYKEENFYQNSLRVINSKKYVDNLYLPKSIPEMISLINQQII